MGSNPIARAKEKSHEMGLLFYARGGGFEPEGWVGGETWCPLRVGNYERSEYQKPWVSEEERSDDGFYIPVCRQAIARTLSKATL